MPHKNRTHIYQVWKWEWTCKWHFRIKYHFARAKILWNVESSLKLQRKHRSARKSERYAGERYRSAIGKTHVERAICLLQLVPVDLPEEAFAAIRLTRRGRSCCKFRAGNAWASSGTAPPYRRRRWRTPWWYTAFRPCIKVKARNSRLLEQDGDKSPGSRARGIAAHYNRHNYVNNTVATKPNDAGT